MKQEGRKEKKGTPGKSRFDNSRTKERKSVHSVVKKETAVKIKKNIKQEETPINQEKKKRNIPTTVKKTGFGLNEKIRLNRFLSNSGVCSRRDADMYIQTGCVTVNGKIVSELGSKVSLNDEVRFNGQLLNPEKKVYLLLNKPKGYVTTTEDPQERKTVMDLIKNACPERIYPVGRLDKETSGVLLFSNDGELVKKLTHPSYNKKKIYHVFLDKPLTKAHLLEIAKGIILDDGPIAADAISYPNEEDKREVGIEIHSGRNRVVRRIFEMLGYKVEKLDRVLFAGLTKKNLPRGKWRFLNPSEINQLKM
jgi:23S rRNA pseudouridine2605 synthase